MLVAEDDEKIEGVIELKKGRHVAMRFISPWRQRQCIGRRFFHQPLIM
jgi:hypothetical protein